MSLIEDVREEVRGLDESPARLRTFALIMASACVLGALLLFRRHHLPPAATLGVIAAVWLGAMAVPRALRPVHRAWMTFAFAAGWVSSRVMLALIFYAALTPLALVARLVGKRFVTRGADASKATYWEKRDQSRRVDYDKLY